VDAGDKKYTTTRSPRSLKKSPGHHPRHALGKIKENGLGWKIAVVGSQPHDQTPMLSGASREAPAATSAPYTSANCPAAASSAVAREWAAEARDSAAASCPQAPSPGKKHAHHHHLHQNTFIAL